VTAALDSRAVRWTLAALGFLALAAVALALGRLVPAQPMLAVGAGLAILALGITAAEPAAIPLLAMPLLLVGARVGGGSFDLSASDAALAAATMVALAFAPRPFSPAMRNLLWLSALYQFATLFTVFANPYRANVIEWFHAWMLISGALIVGWTIGRRGLAKLGLTLFLVPATALAVIVIVQGVVQFAGGDFSAVYPSWPFGMHKNFAGCILGFAAITAYARPTWMGWSRGWALMVFWLTALGLLFTQSRQAIVGLGIALLVVAFRRGELQKRSRAILLVIVPILTLVVTLVQDQVESGNEFNSFFSRVKWFEDSVEIWSQSPLVGHGLRYWNQGRVGLEFQPPNAELEVIASAGIIGLVAFLILSIGAVIVLWRVDPAYGTLAAALVLSRLVQGQFDIFWVAGQVSVPYMLVGVCLGAQAATSNATMRPAGSHTHVGLAA